MGMPGPRTLGGSTASLGVMKTRGFPTPAYLSLLTPASRGAESPHAHHPFSRVFAGRRDSPGAHLRGQGPLARARVFRRSAGDEEPRAHRPRPGRAGPEGAEDRLGPLAALQPSARLP